MTISAMTVAYS